MKKYLSLIFSIVIFNNIHAQYFQGFVNSNYSGTNGMYFNPATLADTRYRVYVNLVGANANFANNYAEARFKFSTFQYAKQLIKGNTNNSEYFYFNNDGTGKLDSTPVWPVDNSNLVENLNGKAKYINLSAELRGPSFSYSWNNKNTIAFGSRLFTGLQVNDLAEPFARFAVYGLDKKQTIPYWNIFTVDNSFSLNIGTYNEVSLSYARKIIDLKKHYFTGGLTFKYYQGMMAFFVQNKGVNVNFINNDSLIALQTDLNYGLVKEQFYGIQNSGPSRSNQILSDLFPKSVLGRGIGGDIGFQYEYRPEIDKYTYQMDGTKHYDDRKIKYLYKVGIAIVNLGYINYNNPEWIKYRELQSRKNLLDTAFWGQLSKAHITNSNELDSNLNNVFGFKTMSSSFKWYMPASINFNFDYKMKEHFFIGGVLMQSLKSKNGVGFRLNSLLGITPRLEYKWLEIAMPIMATFGYKKLNMGVFLRTGCFYIGSDNLGGFFGSNTFNGLDFYTGVNIPLFKGKPSDRDKDGVSDKKDYCIHVPGSWTAKGCPDMDGDSIPDDDDKCKTLPGPFHLKGCPDTDGDGVTDDDDLCPKDKGLASNKGCPDVDGDGVYDKNDQCPNEFGKPDLDGCPDRDNDGIKDAEDKCPDLPGSSISKGCPDRDGDGVYDNVDQCPDLKGTKENNGCPDSDGDGIADNLDKCPNQSGSAKFDGCPDRDLDGVPDKDDNCPDQYGDPLNVGCPIVIIEDTVKSAELDVKEQEVLKNAFEFLEFATGKSALNKESKPTLDELAKVLIKRPEIKLIIGGHTDNVGKAESNLKLSKDRANEVKKYLISKGVKSSQITAEGFGDTRPVADNSTESGRQKNRRVELKIAE